jgi:hydrogenase maturation protease
VHLVRDAFPSPRGRSGLKIICVGNPLRGDDAAGFAVARRLAGSLAGDVELLEREGEPTALIDAFDGADAVWLIDAVRSGAPAGTVHRLDASETELPVELFRGSTHHVGLAEAVELARALGRLPRRTIVYGIEGAGFELGEELTPAVADASERVAAAVLEEVEACTSGR